MRRIPWQLAAAIVLVGLLAVLATLQYRWLGDVSQAERDRIRAGLRTRAADVAQEFDGELTRAYIALHPDTSQLDADPAGALADGYQRWRADASQPELIRAIYLADGPGAPKRLDVTPRTLVPAEWPPEVSAELTRTHAGLPSIPGLPPLLLVDAINARIPALIIAVPRIRRSTAGAGQTVVVADPGSFARSIVALLDRDRLVRHVLEPLVAKHFGDPATSDYVVTVAPRDDPKATVFSSIAAGVDDGVPDLTMGLFDLRLQQPGKMAGGRGDAVFRRATERVAITIVRRGDSNGGPHLLTGRGEEGGAWQLRVRHRAGSLDAMVASSRRRNVGISLGILAVLAASVVLALAGAIRQQRLAQQQMEFVAGVSHELRTPLAVICSAGENLADGVVADGPQVKRYGALIQTEGRRLADMVERVMEFAGISSGARPRIRAHVDLTAVVAEAVRGVSLDARERNVSIAVHASGALPPVEGDADALRSALQNIVGNAVKYSPAGSTVDVSATTAASRVRIQVVDRGLGIDREDLPHVFKPFYRGKRAVGAQVRGAGVGLSVVRHIVALHDGRVDITSAPGEGTTVTVDFPITRPDAGAGQRVGSGADTQVYPHESR